MLLVLYFWMPISAAGTTEKASQDWKQLDIQLAQWKLMLGEVNVSGPQVISLEFTPYRSQGVLEGCGYAYQVLLRDWAYRQNQPTIAYGSIVYFSYRGKVPALVQRIGLTDIEQRGDRLWQRNVSVHYAYLRRGAQPTAGRESSIIDGEDGVRVFTYVDPELEKMVWLFGDDVLTVAFNREADKSDLEFDLSILYSEIAPSLAVCLRELAG